MPDSYGQYVEDVCRLLAHVSRDLKTCVVVWLVTTSPASTFVLRLFF